MEETGIQLKGGIVGLTHRPIKCELATVDVNLFGAACGDIPTVKLQRREACGYGWFRWTEVRWLNTIDPVAWVYHNRKKLMSRLFTGSET